MISITTKDETGIIMFGEGGPEINVINEDNKMNYINLGEGIVIQIYMN